MTDGALADSDVVRLLVPVAGRDVCEEAAEVIFLNGLGDDAFAYVRPLLKGGAS